MGIKLGLGDINPLVGMFTGNGMYGKLNDKLGYAAGLMPGHFAEQRKDEAEDQRQKEEKIKEAMEQQAAQQKQQAAVNQFKSTFGLKKGGKVSRYDEGGDVEAVEVARKQPTKPVKKDKIIYVKKGGSIKSASSRADGIAQRGKTRGKIV